jgi:hypothetical protein
MATRLYFHYGLAPTISPLFDEAWETVIGSSRYKCSPVKQGTAFTEIVGYEYSASANEDTAIVQFISDPLVAQTINGTIKGQILARESAAAANLCMAMVVRVVSALGVPRGTLFSFFPDPIGTELSSGDAVNRKIPASAAISELEVQAGDRIIIELGSRAFNTDSSPTYYAFLTVGDAAATDLPEDEAEVAYLNPWIEFSGSLVWISETALAASGSMRLSGTSAFGSSTIVDETVTALAADTSIFATCMVFSGDSAINSVAPAQFVGDGHIGLSAPGIIDSILPTVTALVAVGGFDLSASATINDAILVTALAASGSISLSSRGEISSEQTRPGLTAFAAIGAYRLSGESAIYAPSPADRSTALVATGGFELGRFCAIDFPVATVHAFAGVISYLLGGQPSSAVVSPLITALAAAGGYVLGSPGVEPEETVFEAWVLNGQSFEPSMFSAFRFNSFAQRGAQTFAAGEDGIFLLGGDDDDGEAFHTGARIGPANFGSDREKRMRGIQLGNCGPDTKVRVASDMGDSVFTPGIDSNRVVVSRDIQGREFVIDIQDFQELSHFEAMVLKLARR